MQRRSPERYIPVVPVLPSPFLLLGPPACLPRLSGSPPHLRFPPRASPYRPPLYLPLRSLPKSKSEVEHFMQWFDTAFRTTGALLPFLPWLLRCCSCLGAGTGGGSGGGGRRRLAVRPTLQWACLAAYIFVAAVRIGLYVLHLAVQGRLLGGGGGHGGAREAAWVSDHVFLAASVVACLQVSQQWDIRTGWVSGSKSAGRVVRRRGRGAIRFIPVHQIWPVPAADPPCLPSPPTPPPTTTAGRARVQSQRRDQA